jgi:hypothetical protein
LSEKVVNKHRAMRDKAVVADCDELANERMGLNASSATDLDTTLDLDKGTHEDTVPEATAVEVNRFHQRHGLAELDIDNADFTNNW